MILQALKEYYDRKAADPDAQMAPPGLEWKEIPYVLVLDPEGKPVSLNCTYEGAGKSRRAKKYLVPQAVKKAYGIAANLLWDNPEYVFGAVLKGKPDRVKEQHQAFKQRIEDLGGIPDKGLTAVKHFLSSPDILEQLAAFSDAWKGLLDEGTNVSFQLAGATGLVCESPAVRGAALEVSQARGDDTRACLVTGEEEETERLHTSIKGVWGAQSSGANIVSFNLDAFRSFGKEQGANAPVGRQAAFAYTTALNHLLEKDSRQRMQVGDASTVFWSDRSSGLEENLADFFSEPPKDDPDRNTRAVESLFRSVQTGALSQGDAEARFYVLGLAPNASRISIRFWISDTVKGMSEQICRHFEDLRIVHGPRDRDALSLFRLLVSIVPLGKADNIPPNLAGDVMRAALQGLPYPQTLLQAAIRRIRTELGITRPRSGDGATKISADRRIWAGLEITHPRAAIIKACLNRSLRNSSPTGEREITMSLDETNPNLGYRLGRLFAALEKVQAEANPGINATIRDRFYGAASGTPVAVFANLMRLKNHHLAKLDSPGRRIFFEKLIGSIMGGIDDFPPHLSLADQGRFAIGYYHQMQDFYTAKSDKSE